jgi:RNA polymerase sigma factor (sigma-70 family)
VRNLTTVPDCRINDIDAPLLDYPLGVLNLTVRASNCLGGVPSINALLALNEAELIKTRNFGRTSLLDVRRKLVHFCVDHLALPPGHSIRLALYDPHPALKSVWEAPAQERSLREVIGEILDCLDRADEVRAAGSWTPSPIAVGPPKRCDYESASLSEVCEAFFNCLKERERQIVELRYGPLDSMGATLAEVGETLGLTRERVRQILQGCITRLVKEEERRWRAPLADAVRGFVAEYGDVVRETDVAHFLIGRYPPPHRDVGALVRVFLEVEPDYGPVGQGVWVAGDHPPSLVLQVQDSYHSLLRAAGAHMKEAELLAAVRRKCPAASSAPESLLRACLRTDDRLAGDEQQQYGLIEWQWLLPRTLDDYVYLALRSAARPRHYMWITEQVNTLLPDGQEVTPRDIHSTLLDRADLFLRYREGTYALREWETAPRENIGDLVNGALREHGRPMTLDEIVAAVGGDARAETASVAAFLNSSTGYWRTPDGRYGLNDWPLRRPETGVSAEAVS